MNNNYACLLFKYVVKWAENNDEFEKCINRPLGLDSEMIGANWKINKFLQIIVIILFIFQYIEIISQKFKWIHYLNQIFIIRLENKIITSKKLYQLAFNIGKLRGYHPFWKYIWIYTNMEDFIQINGINNVIIPYNIYNKIVANLIIKN
uniref:Uncharacterized protein n=1 Tax=viral metagenome TaxID=1070528 RepID=A0A6C0I0K5_9ZZZZ